MAGDGGDDPHFQLSLPFFGAGGGLNMALMALVFSIFGMYQQHTRPTPNLLYNVVHNFSFGIASTIVKEKVVSSRKWGWSLQIVLLFVLMNIPNNQLFVSSLQTISFVGMVVLRVPRGNPWCISPKLHRGQQNI